MLRELDYKLIEQESHRFDTKKVKTWLKPITECPIDYEDVIKNYNLHEFTIHWYDSGPNYDHADECRHCKKNCNYCKIWEKWEGSERQLTFNNWIDVEGPGIWGMTQRECNENAERFLQEMFLKSGFNERTFYYQPPEDKYFSVFYYNRDRSSYDYWFVFEKKAGAGSRTK